MWGCFPSHGWRVDGKGRAARPAVPRSPEPDHFSLPTGPPRVPPGPNFLTDGPGALTDELWDSATSARGVLEGRPATAALGLPVGPPVRVPSPQRPACPQADLSVAELSDQAPPAVAEGEEQPIPEDGGTTEEPGGGQAR